MTPEKSVLVFQPVYHPFDEALKSVRSMDFTGLRVDIFQALFDSREGSKLISTEEYLEHVSIDATSEYALNQKNAQIEKTRYMKKLCLENDYDFALYAADDMKCEKDALQLLIAAEKDFIIGLMCYENVDDSQIKFSGRILDPEGPQDSDDRPIELHKDFEYGDIISITSAGMVLGLISRKVFELPDFQGFHERSIFSWLQQHGIQAYCHTGVKLKYLGLRP